MKPEVCRPHYLVIIVHLGIFICNLLGKLSSIKAGGPISVQELFDGRHLALTLLSRTDQFGISSGRMHWMLLLITELTIS